MLRDTLNKIDSIIDNSQSLAERRRAELKELTGDLRDELTTLEQDKANSANSIAGFTKVATYEALRDDKNPDLAEVSSHGLERAVEEFKVSHPKLYETIKSICVRLTGLGV